VLTVEALWAFITTKPTVLAVVIAAAVVSWAIRRRITDQAQRPDAIAILFVVAVVVVVALTMTPNEPATGSYVPSPPHFLDQLRDGHLIWARLTGWPDDSEEVANIALYLPIGFLGRLVWHEVLRAAGFGIALTVFIETCQHSIVGRDGSITDIRNNTAGAILGALFAAAAVRFRGRPAPPH
jgi:hypothetical protein